MPDVAEQAGSPQPPSGQSSAAGGLPPHKKRLRSFSARTPASASYNFSSVDEPGMGSGHLKKEFCWFEARQICKYGKSCNFKHSSDGSQNAPMQKVRVRAEPQESACSEDWESKWEEVLCPFFQTGCCWYESACIYKHERAPKDSGYKTSLCAAYQKSGSCSEENCFGAHGPEDLRTPEVWQGVPGYKASLCTFYMLDDLECGEEQCPDAHGELDLRRLPPAVPPGLPANFAFSDAHAHLDHVLLSRRYGSCWFYKRTLCRYKPCKQPGCSWAHSEAERRKPLIIERADFEKLAAEIQSLPGTFGGCVHSCCDVEVYVAFGVHPTTFETCTAAARQLLEEAFERCGRQAVAWGECGLDYYRRWLDIENDSSVRVQMCEVFAEQARVAVRRGLPLVVHSRDAEEDAIQVLHRTVPRDHPVYLHSFMGSVDKMLEFLKNWPGGYVGIAGCVTYPAAWHVMDLVHALPLERMLLETDGPYMAPNPYRGEESHPGHIPWIAKSVAVAKGVSAASVLATGHANFLRFYGL